MCLVRSSCVSEPLRMVRCVILNWYGIESMEGWNELGNISWEDLVSTIIRYEENGNLNTLICGVRSRFFNLSYRPNLVWCYTLHHFRIRKAERTTWSQVCVHISPGLNQSLEIGIKQQKTHWRNSTLHPVAIAAPSKHFTTLSCNSFVSLTVDPRTL